jgi:nucleotide-binding universal stress UspA family protein
VKTIKTILVATDFSGAATNAAERAARVAAEHGAALRLVHVVSEPALAVLRDEYPVPSYARERLCSHAETRLGELRARVSSVYGIATTQDLRIGVTREAIAEAAAGVDLLVLGARGTNPVVDSLIGTTAARVLRTVRSQILIVKQQAAAAYGRVLVAVDFSRHTTATLDAADGLAPRSSITVVHAFDVPFAGLLHLADASEQKIATWRALARERATAELRQLIATREGGTSRWRAHVQQGDPVSVILEAARNMDADLIVIGKHGRSRLEETLIGSVTRRTLANARCDVLVVPPQA